MATKRKVSFNPKAFLDKVGEGRSIATYCSDQVVFSQGDAADSVFYIQRGKLKVTVVSEQARKPLSQFSERMNSSAKDAWPAKPQRLATVRTMAESSIMRLKKSAIIRVIDQEPPFRRCS